MSNIHSRHLFVARDAELDWLRDAWRLARSGQPQFRVLLGESGLGKTRLVQEFYRWLSREQDPPTPSSPEGYWPDAFTSESTSLDVNPTFPSDRVGPVPPIPWLWWGLRWVKPDERNQVANGCALIDYRADLDTHVRPMFAASKLEEATREVAWKVAGNLIPALGWFTAGRDLINLATKDRREMNRHLHDRDAGPAAASEASRRELESQVLDTFRFILDPDNPKVATVPVILVLDDAQWADPVTLRFLHQLWLAARSGGWALLVIATHWEHEWKANLRDTPAPAGTITQLADLPSLLGLGGDRSGERVIHPIPDLGALVMAALPGVTPAQRVLLLDKAGGNPRLLEEIFRHLLDHPQLFEGRDAAGPLTKRAEKDIRDRQFDYHELVDERFCRLEDHVRRALGWSSAQGMRFLASITEAIARRVAPDFDHAKLRPGLEAAEDPHSLIQLFRDRGRFNLGEFRQTAFQHVARENLALGEAEVEAVESALRDYLAAWLKGDPAAEGLEPAEGRDALAMARRLFTPDRPETRGPWALATARLAALHASEYLWKQAHDLARTLADFTPPTGWSPDDLSDDWLEQTITLLLRMRDLKRADRLASDLLRRIDPGPGLPAGPDPRRDQSRILTLRGDIKSALGDRESALASFRRGLEISERLVADFGETPEALRDLSVSLGRIADIEQDLGDREGALASFRRGLEIDERLVTDFGETPEALRDLSVSLNKVGDVMVALGDREGALASFRRGLEISERLVADFGETPEALRDLWVSLLRVADVELDLGNREGALASFRRGLEISERLVADFGETPQALRDLSVSLNKVGDVMVALGDREGALASFRRGLEIRERLVADFGETPEALRDLSVSLGRIADIEQDLGDREGALASFRRGLEIDERLVTDFGETPEALRDLMISHVKLADLAEKDEAFDRLRRAKALAEGIIARGWGVPQNDSELAWIEARLRFLEGEEEK